MEGSGRHAVMEGPSGQEEYSSHEQQEQAEQEPLQPEALFGVLKAFDHIQDFSDAQLEEMHERLMEDLTENRFSDVNQEYFKRDKKEYKEALLTYVEKMQGYLGELRKTDPSLSPLEEVPWPIDVLTVVGDESLADGEVDAAKAAELEEQKKALEAELARQRAKPRYSAPDKVAYYEELIAGDLSKVKGEVPNAPEKPMEALQASDLVSFVYQNGLGNKGVDLLEVVSDKFNRLKENLPQGEDGKPEAEALAELENAKRSLAPEIVLLAKLQLEMTGRENSSVRMEGGREKVLPPDAKLNREAVQNLDPMGLAFQLKSMPNVDSAKDMLNWGYTPREAILIYEWSVYSQELIDPSKQGNMRFLSEEENETFRQKLAERAERIYPESPNVKLQKQAALRRMMKYLSNTELFLQGRDAQSIGLNSEELAITPEDRADRLVNLISGTLREDADLEPDATYKATRSFREETIPTIAGSLLKLRSAESDEQKKEYLGEAMSELVANYELFSRIHKDELGMPELYDKDFRDAQAEKAMGRIFELIRISAKEAEVPDDYKDDAFRYLRLTIEIDHNAALGRKHKKRGFQLTQKEFGALQEQELALQNEMVDWIAKREEQAAADRERDKVINEAIGAIKPRSFGKSERLVAIEAEQPSMQPLRDVNQEMKDRLDAKIGEFKAIDESITVVEDRRKALIKLRDVFAEKLGIKT